MEENSVYLKAMMSLVARQTFSPEQLAEIVSPRKVVKILEAFNLCDGSRGQTDIAKSKGLDSGNFSRTVNQWIDDGVLIRVGSGKEEKPIHVYPIPTSIIKSVSKKG